MSCGIYKITNQVNEKIYIGQSINIESRWIQHIATAKNNEFYGHYRSLLYRAMRKYGTDKFIFEIIEECDVSILDERESYWIKYYDSTNREKGYNLLSGGKQGRQFAPQIFYKMWDEGKTVKEINEITEASYTTIEHILRGYKDYSLQNSIRRSILASEKHSDSICKIPLYQYDLLGNYITEYESAGAASRALFGDSKHLSMTVAINSGNHMAYNFLWSREKVEKMQMYKSNHIKAVQCIETGEIYVSTRAAARAYNMKSPSSIIACCQGKQKSAAKDSLTGKPLHWRYYTTEENGVEIEEWHPQKKIKN